MCEVSCHLACASPGAGTQSHSMECTTELCEYHPVERGQAPLSWALYLDQQIARWKTNSMDMPEGITSREQAGGGFLCIGEVRRYSESSLALSIRQK